MKLRSLSTFCLKDICCTVCIGKNLFAVFSIKNVLNQGAALSQFPFNFTLKCAIKNVQGSQKESDLNGTQQHPAYAESVNVCKG
jgi:hypothetical protein